MEDGRELSHPLRLWVCTVSRNWSRSRCGRKERKAERENEEQDEALGHGWTQRKGDVDGRRWNGQFCEAAAFSARASRSSSASRSR